MSLVRRAARPMLASMFLIGGYDQLKNPASKTGAASPLLEKARPLVKGTPLESLVSDPELAVRANATAMLLGGAMLATGRFPRVGAAILAASIVPTTVAGHAFWAEQDPQAKKMQQIQFSKNLSMLGGLLLAAADTDGKPGLAYRAGMAQSSVKRLSATARREARIAALQAQNAIG